MVVDADFHSFRKLGIGGSDILNLLGLEPWGCPRRLAYDKQGAQPDHPFNGNNNTERGELYEPIAKIVFERRYGARILPVEGVVDPACPILRCHPDGIIASYDGLAGMGAVEIKCPTAEMFKTYRHDVPDAYVLQLQYAMGLTPAQVERQLGWLRGSAGGAL
jgi:putative phage-type endonuclease